MTHQLKKNILTRHRTVTAFNSLHVFLLLTMALFVGCQWIEVPPDDRSTAVKPVPILDSIALKDAHDVSSENRILIALHGLGDTPEQFSALFEHTPLKSPVILPRAPTAYSRGGSWFPVAIPVKSTPESDLKKNVAVATQLVCRFIATSNFSRRPVITGFSQGGILSFTVAVTCPDLIAAAVPVAGFLPLNIPKNRTIPPVTALHGTSDRIVDFKWGKKSIDRLKKANVSATLYQYENIGHTISPAMHDKWISVLIQYLK